MSKINNDTTVTLYTKRIGAMKKYVSNQKSEIPVGGEVLKPSGVLQSFQDCLDARTAVTVTHAAYKSALADRVEADERFRVTDEAMKGWVLNRFGVGSTEAIEFGYSARKAPAVSAADRATAVLLNQATRKARGTMGKREKLKIKGTLDVPTAPAAPAIVSAPAVVTSATAAATADVAVHAPVAAPVVATGSAPVAAPVITPVAAPTPVAPVVNAPAAGGSA